MAGYKETPRQKMIAMMYLVLTALLALNVSKEVLDAFVVVNDSLVLTNQTFAEKTDDLHRTLENRYMINQSKVAPFRQRAIEAKRISDELRDYISDTKWRLISEVEGIEYDTAKVVPAGSLKTMDNYMKPTEFFMGGSDDGSAGEGWILMGKINEYRENLLNILTEQERSRVRIGLITDGEYANRDGIKQNWVQYNFYRTVLAANLAILNKIITEIYNAEFDVVNHLLIAIDADDFKHDTIALKVLPKRDYVFVGENYEAEIIVAAYATKQDPEVYIMEGVDHLRDDQISRARRISGDKGVVKVNLPAQSEGLKRFAGIFRIVTPSGDINDFHFNSQYQVARPATTIAASKMNVLYSGVDNPIEIAAPGVALEALRVSISPGEIRPDVKAGNYFVTVPPPTADKREAIVTVSANIHGQLVQQGAKEFRIKALPDPIPEIAGRGSGPIDRNLLAESVGITASMKGIEFEYRFEVISFRMTTVSGGRSVNFSSESYRLTPDMITRIRNLNRGDNVYFEEIRVRGPEGVRLLPTSISFNII
jgi:gliding motility-associated protein GldM